MTVLSEVFSSILLFCLVFGMSATVDMKQLKKQLRNRNALLTGISLQFVILPFLGFLVVSALNLDAPLGITLLVVTSSPGGSYSNWWCSMFNADLALSVTMTAISTVLSTIMLPANLVLYATTSYSNDVVKSLDWTALFLSLVVVIGGISSGLICSATVRSPKFNLMANKVGNIAGILLVTFSVVVSSTGHDAELWSQPAIFYIGVGAPCLIGLSIATWMASYFRLEKPERVAVAVECCYQNTGIATSVAITMFKGAELSTAIGVPLFYGICEAFFLGVYCLICWKSGWTKAPVDENICVVIATSYEVKEMMEHDHDAIEVVLGSPSTGGGHQDLIFASTDEGYQIDEVSLESLSKTDDSSSPDNPGRRLSEDFPIEDNEDEEEGNRRSQGKKYAVLGMSDNSNGVDDRQPAVSGAPIPADGKQID
uniref:Uncharacterized protein n=1 Tax=Cyclophora tenuis TaxID=216820 RepID=A0A7S1D3K6_CYCTE|mmetsp:Transcript_1771/g.3103  ORF Transcript_1771/g.3103 Transcript_1771/m.3103 type:complete len:426 (+) Transcript_1771:216-1493(+)